MMESSPSLGGHGYRAGVVPAVLLHEVLRETFHGGRLLCFIRGMDWEESWLVVPTTYLVN